MSLHKLNTPRLVAAATFVALLTSALITPALQAATISPATAAAPTAQQDAIKQKLSGMQIPFIENKGQMDKSVAFYAPTFTGTVFVTKKGELVYALPAKNADDDSDARTTQVLTERLVGGKAVPAPLTAAATKVSYFLGNDKAKWQSDVSTNSAVSLGEVWQGIDVELHAYGKNVEKFFTVRPGASVDSIKVQLDGAASLKISQDGALDVTTESGVVRFTPPVAWQEKGGKKLPVQVAYLVQDNSYGFKLGQYDAALPVIIDPLLQSTYLGGADFDYATSIAIHPVSGDVYVAGNTRSFDFPIVGGVQATQGGDEIYGYEDDIFITRLNSTLTTIVQSTYLGGLHSETFPHIAIDPVSSDILVSGTTSSTNFPGTTGGAQAQLAGGTGDDAFITRLNSSLTTLIQSTYLGGYQSQTAGQPGTEWTTSIAIHPTTGDVYISGRTDATDFPGTVGGAQAAYRLGAAYSYNNFIARMNSGLTTLLQSTYLGLAKSSNAIAIHPTSGEIYITGGTASVSFAATTGGAQAKPGGSIDGFVSRLNSSLTLALQSTFLGGTGDDNGAAILIHPTTGEVYVSGTTASPNFPGTAGGAQPTPAGTYETFVSRLNTTLTTLLQSTYLGGSDSDTNTALSIHPSTGEIYVVGNTRSTNFPGTTNAAQGQIAGSYDSYIARFNSNLTTLLQSTYLGSSDDDFAVTLAVHPQSGDVYVAGNTASIDFPVVTGGAQGSYGGNGRDGYVTRLSAGLDRTEYTLTTAKSGVGSGTVSTTDGLINCGIDCSESYAIGQAITLFATPASDSLFGGWSGACSNTSGDCVVTMNASKTATASFYTASNILTVSKSSDGFGTVTTADNLINCGADCTEDYAPNTLVTLTAKADLGSKFVNWSGACNTTFLTCTVTMDAAKSATAKFNLTGISLIVSKLGTGSGTVTSTDGLVNCGFDCKESYTLNTVVTLTAVPSNGSTFAGWSGSCSGTSACTVTMSAAKTVKATFNVAAAQ